MALCLLVTLPLELVIGARVWRRPRIVARTLAVPFVLFYAWDAIAIHRGNWTFADRFTTRWHLPFGVPLEEAVFFLVVPLCALLTYEAVTRLLGRLRHQAPADA